MAAIDDAVGLWRGFNYSGSGDFLDESGNSYDLTLQNSPTFNASEGSFTLNGSNQYFSRVDTADFDFAAGEDFTVAVLATPDTSASNGVLMAKRAGYTAGEKGWMLYTLGSTNETRTLIADGTNRNFQNPGTSYTDDVKQLFVGRREAGTTCTANVDTTTTTVADNTTATLANATNFALGSISGGGDYFAGKIFAAAIWRRLLSDAEVAGLEAELSPSSGSNLMLLGVG